MQNALMTVRRDDNTMFVELQERSTGMPLATIEIDWSSVGDAMAKGGLDRYPADARVRLHDRVEPGDTLTETREELIECAMLSTDKEAQARECAIILKPYEVNGWKAVPGQLGDKARIRRQLPTGGNLYGVQFTRQVPKEPR